MSAGKGRKGAEAGITQAGAGIQAAGELTPEERTQYRGSFDLGKLIEQLLRYQQGLGGAPQGYLNPEEQYLQQTGELGRTYYGQTLQEAKDPYSFYQSTLQPELELTQDFINRQAQSRGLIRSGIPIEQMGRAGVELAIRSAGERMAARERALGRAGELTSYAQGRTGENLASLANLYGQQQQYGQVGMGRQLQGQVAAAPYYSYGAQARLGDIYGRRAAMYALPGQIIEAGGRAATSGVGSR